MPASKYYSAQLEQDLIVPLCHGAKARQIPMTRLASALVREGLARHPAGEHTSGPILLREEPTAEDAGERK